MTLVVGVPFSSRSWRGELQRHCRDHVADVVVSLLHDGREVVGRKLDVLVVDDDTSWLSAALVSQCREAGVSVVGVFDPDEADGFGRQHLRQLGIAAVAPVALDVEDLLELLRSQKPDPTLARSFSTLTAAQATRRSAGDRRIIAVGGPAGSGATEVAIGLAQSISDRASKPVLVDVDETHPSLARRLGLCLHPHLLTAVDAVRRERTSPPTTLEPETSSSLQCLRACVARPIARSGGRPRAPFDVIVGIATRDDWNLVCPEDVGAVVSELSAVYPVVIARLGPSLEDLSRYVGRFETSRHVAGRATRLVGVCEASPTGLLRFLDWMIDVVGLIGDAPFDVVLNRVPGYSGARSELVAHLQEVVGGRVNSFVCVPSDQRVTRAAWDGSVIAQGPFRKALKGLRIDEV